jgi:hypothetical protein
MANEPSDLCFASARELRDLISSRNLSVGELMTAHLPIGAAIDWPKEIDGVKMDTHLDWMRSAYWISTTLAPALPAGFAADGLPVGIQIVGQYRDDIGVLQLGHAFEQAAGFGRIHPPEGRE